MLRWLVIASVIFLLDQVTKLFAIKLLPLHYEIAIMPGLNFTLAFNKGAAFGLLANSAGWQTAFFITLALFVVVMLIMWLKKLQAQDFLEAIALTCILGGALGNLLDRIRLRVVIDFIDVYYKDWHWYTFNIADIAICVGTLLLAITVIKPPNHLQA